MGLRVKEPSGDLSRVPRREATANRASCSGPIPNKTFLIPHQRDPLIPPQGLCPRGGGPSKTVEGVSGTLPTTSWSPPPPEGNYWRHLPPGLFCTKKHRYFYRCFLTLSGSLTFFNGSCVRGLDQTKSKLSICAFHNFKPMGCSVVVFNQQAFFAGGALLVRAGLFGCLQVRNRRRLIDCICDNIANSCNRVA